MKKRVIAFILIFTFTLPLFSVPAYAKYDEEILFNDIPWGTSYEETISLLKEKYDITFGEPKFHEEWVDIRDKEVLNAWNNRPKEDQFSINYGFSIRSNETVNVAGYKAVINLVFAFFNDGKHVLNTRIEDSGLTGAYYYFYSKDVDKFPTEIADYSNDEIAKIEDGLIVKLKSLYGELETASLGWEHRCSGKNGTSFSLFSHGDLYLEYFCGLTCPFKNETRDLIKKQIEQECTKLKRDLEQQEKEFEDSLKENTSGL